MDYSECPRCPGGGSPVQTDYSLDEDFIHECLKCSQCGLEWERNGSVDITWDSMKIIDEPEITHDEIEIIEENRRIAIHLAKRYGTNSPQSIHDYWGVGARETA